LLCVTWFGWRWAFVVFALLGVVWCAVFLWWFRDDPARHRAVNAEERQLLEGSRVLTTHAVGQRHWMRLLLTRRVGALGLQYFCFSYVWYFYITWLPTYLREGRGQTASHAAALAVLPLLFGGFGSLATGIALIRVARLPRRAIACGGFLATAVLLYAITRLASVVPAMLAMGMASFASDLALPISWDACVEIGGPYTATVGATMNMLGNFAGFIAPVTGGIILERTGGNWNVLIETMAVAAVVSALCWLYLDPEAARRERETAMREIAVSQEGLAP
jgi:MFS transporter, ACS family, glucarate transporter